MYGARPLQRLIQTKIKEPIANYLLSNNDTNGTSIKVDLKNNQLSFNFKKKKIKKKIRS